MKNFLNLNNTTYLKFLKIFSLLLIALLSCQHLQAKKTKLDLASIDDPRPMIKFGNKLYKFNEQQDTIIEPKKINRTEYQAQFYNEALAVISFEGFKGNFVSINNSKITPNSKYTHVSMVFSVVDSDIPTSADNTISVGQSYTVKPNSGLDFFGNYSESQNCGLYFGKVKNKKMVEIDNYTSFSCSDKLHLDAIDEENRTISVRLELFSEAYNKLKAKHAKKRWYKVSSKQIAGLKKFELKATLPITMIEDNYSSFNNIVNKEVLTNKSGRKPASLKQSSSINIQGNSIKLVNRATIN
jgi:hypothetical protein